MAKGRIDELFDAGIAERITETAVVAEGRITRYERLKVELPDGSVSERDIVRHPGACVIVPIDEEGYVYMVGQYRVAFERVTLELPAGKLEAGEQPLDCAARELLEETGLKAKSLRHAVSIMTTPGFCDEVIHVFIATELEMYDAAPDGDEFLRVVMFPMEELVHLITVGEIHDAKTIVGVLLADRERREKKDAEQSGGADAGEAEDAGAETDR